MKIESLKLQIEIIRTKLMVYLALGGGSWMYAIQKEINPILAMAAWILFSLASIGVFLNVLKLSQLERNLREV